MPHHLSRSSFVGSGKLFGIGSYNAVGLATAQKTAEVQATPQMVQQVVVPSMSRGIGRVERRMIGFGAQPKR